MQFLEFKRIAIDTFIDRHKQLNPDTDLVDLKASLLYFKSLRDSGELCQCGNPIWIVGSAIVGKGCFTCITGETDTSEDFEIE